MIIPGEFDAFVEGDPHVARHILHDDVTKVTLVRVWGKTIIRCRIPSPDLLSQLCWTVFHNGGMTPCHGIRESLLDATWESGEALPCDVPAKGVRARDCAMWFPGSKVDDGRLICTPCLELSVKKENSSETQPTANVSKARSKRPRIELEGDTDNEDDEDFQPGSESETSDSDFEYGESDSGVNVAGKEKTVKRDRTQTESRSLSLSSDEEAMRASRATQTESETQVVKKCDLCTFTAPTWIQVMDHLKFNHPQTRNNIARFRKQCPMCPHIAISHRAFMDHAVDHCNKSPSDIMEEVNENNAKVEERW